MKLIPLLPLTLLLALGCSNSESAASGPTTTPAKEIAQPDAPAVKAPAVKTPEIKVPDVKTPALPTYELPDMSGIQSASVDKVMDIRSSLLDDTTSLLQSVTDVESAKKASGGLAKIAASLEPLKQRETALENGSMMEKASYAKAAVSMLGNVTGLSSELNRVAEIPGVTDVLQSSIEKIIGYFQPAK